MIYSIQSLESVPSDEQFYVDANILYFIYFCDQDSKINKTKSKTYLKFITKLQNSGNQLHISALNLQELVHVAEKAELEKYCQNNNIRMTLKKYRDIQEERLIIQDKLETILQQICSTYFVTDEFVDLNTIHLLIKTYNRHRFDPIDFLAVCPKCRDCKSVSQNFNIITDDSDFKKNSKFRNDPNINLYTI
ncbi:hypothetical protein MmiHf6_04620 [Methanimicrococcus hongohii]|uniref:PIN domain-containing protein n=1 Tax=Methanimicrococcus hongohii TaxID=3028295 RepID=A0AA96UZV2_9EURY|nr:hypothetical protein [Methanimicrococcus sp. Hf6]WNY23158.1 hypothetical protein MmiHf6_04620 [Methanimicrococcus sp. Hf6]